MILIASVIMLIMSLIFAISLPYITIFYLRTIFSTVQMKLYSPFSLRGLLINGATSLWGISNLTIFISAIQLGWSPNKFKLQLNLSNLQIYLQRRISSLHSVNLINGNQQANILYNFKSFLFQDGQSKRDSYQSSSLKTASHSRIVKKVVTSYFLEGILHLFVIFFMKTFEIVLTDCKVFVVSGIPQHKISFKTAESKKESLMLMQCLAEYNLKCQRINVSEEIDHHNKYKFIFKTDKIWVNSYMHYEKHFILMEDIEMDLIIPFSMSLKQSFQQIKTIFNITDASVNLSVSDFQHFFQLIKQMIFRINRKSEQQESVDEKQVCLFVGKIKLQLNELYQKEFDNFQAKQYLSHLCKANVQLIQFSLSQRNFSITNSTLSITKYSKHSALQREIKILTLPNLQIIDKYPQELVEIRHDDVTVSCHSEEIAFFGKIFSLVNQRIRFQNYNQEIYKDLIENFSPHGTLISQIERMINGSNSKPEQTFQRQVKSKKLIYAPKKLVFLLKMKKLSHIITIDGFTYNRSRNLNELSHEILVNKLTVQHKNFKEFSISNFELIFSETIIQKQLTMRINQIIMQQNLHTLIDYLDSFTLFKHLLQFQSDEKLRSKKPLKKYVSIDAIAVHFENEVVNLNQLKIDKMSNRNELMDSLYFSIERCELILSKMVDRRVEVKENERANHILFWIDSFSLKTTYEQRNSKIKPKATIIINGPSLNLPETNVSKILLFYFKIYASLESHLQAFLINVTGQKLKSLKYHMKEFFKEPDQLIIIVTNLSLSISDTKFDQNLIAFSKTIRQYLYRNPRQNEAEVLSILRRNNKTVYPLLNLKLEKITLQVAPIQSLQPTQKSINQWIQDFEYTNQEKVRNDSSERCRRLKGQQFLLRIRGISMKIRDYPAPILTIDQIKVAGERLRVKKILGGRQNYIKGAMVIGDIFVSVGLGQLSGWQQIGKRMSELKVVNKTVQKQFRNEEQHFTIWHRVLQDWKWRLQVNKDSPTRVEILTGSIPYNGQKFQLEINKVFGLSTTNETYLGVQHFKLSHEDFIILSMPKLQVFSSVKMRQGMLDVFLDVRMVEDVCSFRFSSAIIKQLQELVQLQKEWLLIYGIYERDVHKSAMELEEIQKMTYLQIVSLLAQKISSEKNGNSILNYLNHFQFKFSAQEISLAIIDQELQLLLSAKLLDVFTLLQPDHDIYNQIKVRRSKINLQSVTVSFIKSEKQQAHFIRETRFLSQTQTHIGHVYQFAKCSNLIINFNWYFTEGKKMGLANQWIHADNITAQVSKRMERYCNRMKNLLIFHHNKKMQSVEPRYQKPINKFRKAVLQIIQINRRRKILKGHIKKYNTVVNLQNYELLLKTDDKVMILQGKEKALFFQRIQYGETDTYHSLPCEILTISFPSCRIQLSEGPYESNSFQIMTAGKLTLEIQMSDEKIDEGKCNFQNIAIEITDQGKNILEEIIMFIVDLVNTHELRRRNYNVDMIKYEELINNGREKLKEKIEWNQSDLKWKEKEIFWWTFVFKDVSVLISMAESKILSMVVDKTEMVLHIYDNQKIDRKILFRNIQLINQLQPLDSQYRKILQLGKQNVGLAVIINSYEVTAFSDAPWKYIKQMSFWVQLLKLRVTEELLELLIKYLKTSRNAQEQHMDEQIREYKKKNPDYYKVCSIEPLNMQFWLRSSNVFKRMEGIKLQLDKYEMKDFFYTESELGRNIGFWLLKQVGYKIFSLLGQKIFGDVQSSENI